MSDLTSIIIEQEKLALKKWCERSGLKPNDGYVKTSITRKRGRTFLVTRVVQYINYVPAPGLTHTEEQDITKLYSLKVQ